MTAASLPLLFLPALALAAQDISLPALQLTLSGGAQSPEKVSVLLEILFLLTGQQTGIAAAFSLAVPLVSSLAGLGRRKG